MNLPGAFAASVRKQPQKTALYWGDNEFTYEHLWSQSSWLQHKLEQKLQVKPGDRVGLWLKNCPEFVPAFFAILRAGGVVVPINNFLKAEEVNYILQDAGADVLITDAELGTHHRAMETARPGLRIFRIEEMLRAATGPVNGFDQTGDAAESDLAVLIYTSGTTGRPKGAMLTHGNLLHNVESCRIVLQTVHLDRFAVLLPLFHSYMMTVGMLLPLIVGGAMVLVKSVHPVRNVLQEIIERQATVLPAIPQFYRSIVNAGMNVPLGVRFCVSGAAPLPAQILQEFEAKFGIPLIEGYGLSEASPVVTKNPLTGKRKPGSIGIPIANVEVTIQNEAGEIQGPHVIGELCVRGGNVMQGYWRKPEETAKALRCGWLLTGDIGYVDEEGYFYITDRKKDMLLVNGINVYPREIEEILYQYPGIKEAAVIGKPDVRKGERPVAFLSLNDGATFDGKAVHHFLRRKLADYKVPRDYTVLPALPRNATGKILKTALRELAAKQSVVVEPESGSPG